VSFVLLIAAYPLVIVILVYKPYKEWGPWQNWTLQLKIGTVVLIVASTLIEITIFMFMFNFFIWDTQFNNNNNIIVPIATTTTSTSTTIPVSSMSTTTSNNNNNKQSPPPPLVQQGNSIIVNNNDDSDSEFDSDATAAVATTSATRNNWIILGYSSFIDDLLPNRPRRYIPWLVVLAPLFMLLLAQLTLVCIYFCGFIVRSCKRQHVEPSFGILYYLLSLVCLSFCFFFVGMHFEFPYVPYLDISLAFVPMYPLECCTIIIVLMNKHKIPSYSLWISLLLFGPTMAICNICISLYSYLGPIVLCSALIPWTNIFVIILGVEIPQQKEKKI